MSITAAHELAYQILLRPTCRVTITCGDYTYEAANIDVARALAGVRRMGPVTVREIVEVCADTWGVTVSDILGKDRHLDVIAARGAACLISRELTTLSFPEIARVMGRSNHSTIINASQRAERRVNEDPAFADRLNMCRARLFGMMGGAA